MTSTLLTSIISVAVISGASFFTSIFILRRRKKDKEAFAFAIFWLLVAITFLLMVIRLSAFGMGLIKVDRLVFYGTQICVSLMFVPVIYHGFWKLTGNEKITRGLSLMAGVCTLFFLFLTFRDGVIGPEISDWGSEYSPPQSASIFFKVPYAIGFVSIVIDFLKRIAKAIMRRKILEPARFFTTLSMFLFLSVAGIEALGISGGWPLALFRIIMMTAALIGYFGYPARTPEVDISPK